MSNFTEIPELKQTTELNASLVCTGQTETPKVMFSLNLYNPGPFINWTLPTKELLILNKENLLGRSITRVNQYKYIKYTDTWMCVCTFILSRKGKELKTKMINIKKKAQSHTHIPSEDFQFLYFLLPENIILRCLKRSKNCSHFWKIKNVYKRLSACEKENHHTKDNFFCNL